MIQRLTKALVCAISALFIAISLMSFSPYDVGWTYDNSESGFVYANWAGKSGALCASFLVFFLGSSSWLLTPLLLNIAACFLRQTSLSLRINYHGGMTLCLLTLATWCAHENCDFFVGVPPGGIVGITLARLVNKIHDPFLEQHLLLCLLWLLLLLITGCTWPSLFKVHSITQHIIAKIAPFFHFFLHPFYSIIYKIRLCSCFVTQYFQPHPPPPNDALEKWIQEL